MDVDVDRDPMEALRRRLPPFLRFFLGRRRQRLLLNGGVAPAPLPLPPPTSNNAGARALVLARTASRSALEQLRRPWASVTTLARQVHTMLASTTFTRPRSLRPYSAHFVDTWSQRLRCALRDRAAPLASPESLTHCASLCMPTLHACVCVCLCACICISLSL
jgi:hypothetical protein